MFTNVYDDPNPEVTPGPTPETTPQTTSPRTGDNSVNVLWLMFVIMSFAVVAAIKVIDSREKDRLRNIR